MALEGCRRCPQKQSHSHHHHHCPHCPIRRHCQHCPLHNPHLHANHFLKPQTQPFLTPLPLQIHQQPSTSLAPISQELEDIELDGEEEDDEPVFVLTDEWREFFAKSEARRKLEKKQGKKVKK